MSKEHNHKPAQIPFEDSPNWDYFPSVCKECFDHVLHDKDMILGYDLIDGAIEIIAFLRSLNFNFHVVSHRPDDVAEWTKQWVHEKFGLLVSSTNVVEDKVKVAQELDIKYHIDDAPMHIESFLNQNKVQIIIYSHPYNKGLPGPRIDSWEQYGAYLMWSLHK